MVAVHAGADADFARRLRKASGADPSELGTTRIAGMTNSKWRHEPDFRIITIARGAPGPHRQPALDEAGLVAAPEALEARRRRAVVQWTLARLRDVRGPRAHNSDDADISRADFTWCMTAIDWGWSVSDGAARLMGESREAQENGHNYTMTTARNAAAAIARCHGRPPELG